MTEEHRKPGRPKKHPAADLHFKAENAVAVVNDGDAYISESTTQYLAENPLSEKPIDGLPLHEEIQTSGGSGNGDEFTCFLQDGIIVDLNGWKLLLNTDDHVSVLPPRNGMPIQLSNIPEDNGVTAFWKKTRAFANATKKWEITGKWCDFMTGAPIDFKPKYWRERHV